MFRLAKQSKGGVCRDVGDSLFNGRPKILPGRSRRVSFVVDLILFNVNQLNPKHMAMPICSPDLCCVRLSISFTSCITWFTADTRVADRSVVDSSLVDRSGGGSLGSGSLRSGSLGSWINSWWINSWWINSWWIASW